MGGGQAFKGKGDASQSNALSGEVSVTIAEVYPNGTMLVEGEKLLTLNRGDERVQISGLVRAIDIGPDNRILSNRVAKDNIRYVGQGEIASARQTRDRKSAVQRKDGERGKENGGGSSVKKK